MPVALPRRVVSYYGVKDAGVAELADALDSKSSDRKVVGVQVPPPVLFDSKVTCFPNADPSATRM